MVQWGQIMKLLYSNILPLAVSDGKETVRDVIVNQIQLADRIEIAVGYVSRASLEELASLVEENNIKNICLNIGMYFIEGMPEGIYHTAARLNKKWQDAGIGEIRMVRSFKYHGKIYAFYKENKPFSAIIGSANLGVLKLEANNRRQYEISAITENISEAGEIAKHIEELKNPSISVNIASVEGFPLIYEVNTALSGIELVTEVPKSDIEFYKRCKGEVSFLLPLKVPARAERYMDDGQHFIKSNINVCYAAPRNKRKSRDWYETQLTVAKEITRLEGYPEKNVPFYIVTDDGYWFKAHTTSDGNKQLSAVGDELIMGRWLKGRLVAAGLVNPVNDTQADTEREGMITKEMLEEYGCENLYFKKTGQMAMDEYGNSLDVWMLSFRPLNEEGDGE